MLNGRNCSSTRTLLYRLCLPLLLLIGCGSAVASGNSGPAPQMVPSTISLIAGNAQSSIGGYGGDGQLGPASTLNGVTVLAVDSVGNVYYPDRANSIIREINAQSGVITTVAGVVPSLCTGTVCSHVTSGCADGVAAIGNPIGSSINGIAIDSFGNLYFSDTTTETISVIYRAGTQVANLIKLENPSGVTKSGGVLPGYIYHVAGTVNLSSCLGNRTAAATSSAAAVPAGDGNLAFQNSTFGSIGPLSLDSAGNLYIGDGSPNSTIRVINTQSTSETFFGFTVQPGYIQSIVNCSPLTIGCPVGYGSSPVTLANTGVGGPAGGGVFNTLSSAGSGAFMSVDAFGNVYELNTKNATPSINLGVAYAGGPNNTVLATMINNANLGDTFVAGASTLKATAGDFYYLLQNITLRPSSIIADPAGNLYYQDNHYGEVYRVDINAIPNNTSGGNFLGISAAMYATNKSNTATASKPAFCYPVNANTTYPGIAGYQTIDPLGDGCPAIYGDGPGNLSTVSGYGTTITDGQGNLFMADQYHNVLRKTTLNNVFPATPVGQAFNSTTLAGQQEIQVHFDQSNLPVKATAPPIVTTSSFSIAPGISDFSINPISSNFISNSSGGVVSGIVIGPNAYTTSSTTGINGLPICGNDTTSVDSSLDCVVNVIFSPTAPGLRQTQLLVTTANGSNYSFGLSGIGIGPQLAIDGGAVVPAGFTGLGNTGQVAVTQTGMVYVADPSHDRVLAVPAGGVAQTTVGTGLKSPMGVAVDAAGNAYISDTGNNRIVKVAAITGTQTVIGGIAASQVDSHGNFTSYPGYTFKGPQGITVDLNGNVYVADTGNGLVVEIPAHPALGGATPLLQYPGAPTFGNPVGVAVDTAGNIYVADTTQITIVEIPAGGGDLQHLPGASLARFQSKAVNQGIFNAPSSVAVDAGGNLYVADSTANTIWEVPNSTAPGSAPIPINISNLNLTGNAPSATGFAGGSVALDANGSLYISDSGNSQVLFENRQNPVVNFGTLPLDQPALTSSLTVTNIGNANVSLATPATVYSGDAAFTSSDTCNTTGQAITLVPGVHCAITTTYKSSTIGAQSGSISINGGPQAVSLQGTGEAPLATMTVTVTSPSSGPVAGSPATVTAFLAQPNGGNVPSGTVSFSYTVNGTSAGAAVSVPVSNGQASFTLPTMLMGRQYVVNASYSGDSLDSPTTANPLSIYIPGIPVTVIANSVTFTYGQSVPAITGTVTGILPADQGSVTYKFVTAATSKTPVGTYPITVVFSGGNYLNYGFPTVTTSPNGPPAVATETKASLLVQANNNTRVYGDEDAVETSTVTGLVNSDKITIQYTPVSSSVLNVGTYPLIPSPAGPVIGNYTVATKNAQLTITQAPTAATISSAAPTVLPSALSSDPVIVQVGTAVSGGIGTPSGTVTLTDTFTPLISTAPGLGTPAAPVTIGPIPLVAGVASYTLTSQTPGIHSYTVAYNGDSNFLTSSVTTGFTLEVDNGDFTVDSSADPIQIAPGILPGGSTTVAGESAATPEQATVNVRSVLSFTGTIYLGCQPQNPSYVTCTLSPAAVTLPTPSSGTTAVVQSIASISTPATLPLGFKSEVRHPVSTTVLALSPFGILAFCFRRRRTLSRALWMLVAIAVIGLGLNGCGGTSVAFYTPVPAGPQSVTIYACSVQASCTTANPVTAPLTGSGAGVIRSFTVPINIQ